MSTEEDTSGETLLCCAWLLIGLPIAALIDGACLWVLWLWYAAPIFALPALPFWHAAIAMLLWSALTTGLPKSDQGMSEVLRGAAAAMGTKVLFLTIAAAVHGWIGGL